MARDKGHLGSGNPSLGLKFWRMDTFDKISKGSAYSVQSYSVRVLHLCIRSAMHTSCKKYVTENLAALNICNNKDFVIFIFIIVVEYEINLTSKISRTTVIIIIIIMTTTIIIIILLSEVNSWSVQWHNFRYIYFGSYMYVYVVLQMF